MCSNSEFELFYVINMNEPPVELDYDLVKKLTAKRIMEEWHYPPTTSINP